MKELTLKLKPNSVRAKTIISILRNGDLRLEGLSGWKNTERGAVDRALILMEIGLITALNDALAPLTPKVDLKPADPKIRAEIETKKPGPLFDPKLKMKDW